MATISPRPVPGLPKLSVACHRGFTIDDVFVVGYGTDHAEEYRHLPCIGVVE